MTAIESSLKPWVTGEWDLSALFRTSVRILDRAQMLDDIAREIQRTRKCLGSRFVVMLFDIDELRSLVQNDGIEAGDEMVKAIVERVGPMLSPHDSIANLGAGRIAILADTTGYPGVPEDFAQDIQRQLMSGVMVADQDLRISSDVGIAPVTGAHVTPDEILGNAAIALRRARGEGTLRVVLFHNWMTEIEVISEPQAEPPVIST